MQSLNGTIENIVFSPTLTTKINAFSKEMVSRNYLIMLAAYYILLSRYTGQKNITIGVPLSNRRQKYFEQVFGCCVNILPISVDLSDNPSFLTLLKCVRMAMLGSHRNQEIPFEQILHLKKTERNLDYNPIFQTGFTFEHPMKLSLHDLKVESVYCHHGGAQLDLFVTFWENETGQIEGSFEYNTDLFNKDTIERLQKHYLQLLSEVINNKDKTIEEINIVPLSERHQMCYEWNQTVVPLPHKTFIQLFEESVRNCSKKTALICNNHQIQYGKLCEKVNQFASFLIESGIQKETVVALCLDRSVEMVTAILALFKVNCAYLPLDPNFPKQRLNYMLSHSECPCVITEEKYSTFFSEKSLKIINFNKEFKKIENRSIKNYDYTVDLNHIAYIIYTSGSTGKPKGVQITQGNMLNFLLSMKKKPGLTSQDTLAAVTTISFDISVLELFLPLIVGATTLIVGKEDTIDGDKLSSLLKQHQATIMQATPSTWRLLLSASWQCGSSFKILCGGEKFPLDLMKKLTEMSDNVWNMYGPTETTVWSTCFKMNVEDEKVSIGKPIDNTFVYVLDKYLNPVPVGVSGELWIGGLGVAKGYLKNAELSSERFIKNPFDKNEGSVMYGTGDLCRFLPDGTIEVLNRIDNQVKIRGFRIEPAEIEINLKEHSLVDDAVVTACDDEFGNKQLVGFIVTKKSIDDKLIKEFLKNKLPSYMIPDYFIVLKKFPLTSNGKVDIRALSQQKRQPILGKKLVTESENDLVSKLLQIWSGILRNRKIGLEDNFFDIGGNSLLIIEVKRQLLEKLNCDVSITTLFQYPTITTLANYISPEEHKGCSNNSINKRVMQKKKALSLRRNTVLRRKRNRQ